MAVLTIIIALLFEDQLNGYVFGQNHAQVFEKNSLVGGTVDGFRTFINDKTGKQIQQVK